MDRRVFIDACRAGGERLEAALRSLYRDHAATLRRECRAVMRDREKADDLVQETFIRIWQRCATFRGDGDVLPWARTVLRRLVVDAFRTPVREEAIDDDDGELTAEAAARVAASSVEARDKPDDVLARVESERCYRRCFARFEADYPLHAAVMRWIMEDGLSNGEIEALLERTPGATREFVSQCRKKARSYFAEWYALVGATDG